MTSQKKGRKDELDEKLEEGLEGSFPASDPPAVTQPGHQAAASAKVTLRATAKSRHAVWRAGRRRPRAARCTAIAAGAFIATTGHWASGAGPRGNGFAACCRSRGAIPGLARPLYGAVLPRRSDGAGGRPPPLLRVQAAPTRHRSRRNGRGRRAAKFPASEMDEVLQRGAARAAEQSACTRCRSADCPMADSWRSMGKPHAVRGSQLLRWSDSGYAEKIARPRGVANVLTPPSIVAVLDGRIFAAVASERRFSRRTDLSENRFHFRDHASAVTQPCGFTLRSVEAGNFASLSAGRIGRRTNSPPQFGQRPFSTPSAHSLQNVHSNEHIIASRKSGGRSRSQHSQFGRSASMIFPPVWPYHRKYYNTWRGARATTITLSSQGRSAQIVEREVSEGRYPAPKARLPQH